MITHFGLDVGNDSIKVAQVSLDNGVTRLLAAGMAKTPPAAMVSDADKDLVAMAEAIKKLKTEAKIDSAEVVVALPERLLFTHIFEVPKMTEDELVQAIPWEAENLIPRPISEVNLDWQIIADEESQKAGKLRIMLVAAPSELVKKYLRVLKLADLVPVVLESELIAITRCLQSVIAPNNTLLLNIGEKSTDIAIHKKGVICVTRSLPTAGEALSRAVSSSLGLDLPVAEEYKKTYGLSTQAEGKVASTIEPILSVIFNEVKKAVHFFEEKEGQPVKLALLTGGGSLLPGLTEYFAKGLGIEVQVVDPFSALKMGEQASPDLKKSSPVFSVCLGLALRTE